MEKHNIIKPYKQRGGLDIMLRDLIWKAFEKTGEIDKYIFYKEVSEKGYIKDEIVTTKEEVAISK